MSGSTGCGICPPRHHHDGQNNTYDVAYQSHEMLMTATGQENNPVNRVLTIVQARLRGSTGLRYTPFFVSLMIFHAKAFVFDVP